MNEGLCFWGEVQRQISGDNKQQRWRQQSRAFGWMKEPACDTQSLSSSAAGHFTLAFTVYYPVYSEDLIKKIS